MRLLAAMAAWLGPLRSLWLRRRLDDDARLEFDAHIDMLADRYVHSGMAPDDARAAAMRQFGNPAWMREEVHRMNGIRWIDGLVQDLRYGFRQMRRGPGFAAIVIATLALGIGGTTAVFSVAQAVWLAPLRYDEPGQLVRLHQQDPGTPSSRVGLSAPHFRALRAQAASFTDVGASYYRDDMGLDLSNGSEGQRLRVLLVTSDYFRTLRAEPLLGPGIQPDDEHGEPGNDRSGARRVVLSHALWRARFNADPSVIGTRVRLSAEPYEIAGIAPEGFQDPIVSAVDAWIPYNLTRDTLTQNYALNVFGRLRTGVTLNQAAAELAVLSESMKARWPEVTFSRVVALSLHETMVAPSRSLLQLLVISVGFVLAVVCVNVANLLLVRSTGRVPEFAVRTALGAGRGRVARQLMVESAVLAGLGGAAGLGLSVLGVDVLQTIGHDALPRMDAAGVDAPVFACAVVVTVTAALVCGAAPALYFARSSAHHGLTRQSRSATGTRRQGRLGSGLAAAQFALALTLLAGAGVLSVSLSRLMSVDLGFRIERVVAFDVSLPAVRYDAAQRARFQEELDRRLMMTIPGVTGAGATSRLPASGQFHPWWVAMETGPLAGARLKDAGLPQHRTVSGEFFKALGIPVLAGRTFDERDDEAAPLRAVVSANLARRGFPGLALEQVIGQRIRVLVGGRREIIGVVGDVPVDVYGTPAATVYTAHRQFAGNRNWALTRVVSTSVPPEEVVQAIRAVVADMDPELVVHGAAPLSDVLGAGTSRQRFAVVLMGAFAAVALLLAALGMYGVLAHTVRQRTQEIGIRVALGATAGQVRGLIVRQAAVVIAAGIALGLLGAVAMGRAVSALLFQTHPWEPSIVAATTGLLAVTALLAAYLPARRAARVDPRSAMQS